MPSVGFWQDVVLFRPPVRLLACALLGGLLVVSPVHPGESLEYRVKAAFLYNFARFVEWPPGTYAERFGICVLGENPFGPALQRLTEKRVRSVPIAVRELRSVEEIAHCQVLFVARSQRDELVEVLARLIDKPVLTVSDIDGFSRVGGIIEFYLERNRVRFSVNPHLARRAGLSVSSKLLGLARVVDSGSRSAGGGNAHLR